MTAHPWRHIAITGASSGLGRALAEASAAACRTAGATVAATLLDVRDAAACAAWIAAIPQLDLLLANAGISGGTGTASEPADQVRAIFDTNVSGVLNTALPALDRMRHQPPGPDGLRGRIGVVASLAAFVASPSAPAYAASKAAVQRWAEAADASSRHHGIRLHAICPGFVRTPMTDANRFPMPFMLTPEQAAARTLRGIAAGRLRVAFPRRTYWLTRLVGALPPQMLA